MKIAYVGLHAQAKYYLGGVGGKIQAQMNLWRQAGHQARLFLHAADSFSLPDASLHVFRRARTFPVQEWERGRALARMLDAIQDYQPDIIYLRYGRYARPLERLFHIAPVVMELNTIDLTEYRLRGPLIWAANRFTRGIMLGRAAGLVAVSHEIAHRPENTRWGNPITVIANGVDLRAYPVLPARASGRPALAMAASPNLAWHGVEKLASLAMRYPDLDVHILGYTPADWGNRPQPANLHLHGWLERAGIEAVLQTCDVACGTLALHANDMQEGSPLKTREALAYGLPLILAYRDTDLDDLQSEYLLRIPNTPDNVDTHAERMVDFARRMRGRRIPRELVAGRIDQRAKEAARLDFMARFQLTRKK